MIVDLSHRGTYLPIPSLEEVKRHELVISGAFLRGIA